MKTPMSKARQNIELVANILIIVVALMIGGFLIQRSFFPASATTAKRPEPKVGEKISLPGVDLTNNPKNVVLVLQKDCRFCNESADFYKRLKQETANKNVKIIAVLPGAVEESAAHLKKLELNDIEVRQASLNSLQIGGTPTLILANDKGMITDFWVGKLPPEKETEVISKLNS